MYYFGLVRAVVNAFCLCSGVVNFTAIESRVKN